MVKSINIGVAWRWSLGGALIRLPQWTVRQGCLSAAAA